MYKLTTILMLSLVIAPFGHAADGVSGKIVIADNVTKETKDACKKQAKEQGLKGDERKKFMAGCMGVEPGALTSQQQKMKTCNAQAKDQSLKGDDRKKFMSDCLKSS